MFAQKHLSRLASYSTTEVFAVIQSKRNFLQTGVCLGNCQFYGLSDLAQTILLRRLHALNIPESIATTMNDLFLETVKNALSRGRAVTFTLTVSGATTAINAAPELAGMTLTFGQSLTGELLSALKIMALNA